MERFSAADEIVYSRCIFFFTLFYNSVIRFNTNFAFFENYFPVVVNFSSTRVQRRKAVGTRRAA